MMSSRQVAKQQTGVGKLRHSFLKQVGQASKSQLALFLGALTFYTVLPVPRRWPLSLEGIARLAPLVGILIGGMLGLWDGLLQLLEVPNLSRSVLTVLVWVMITGGLHLDGAMDTADGLAVSPQRRLQVMADSTTGAFGVMAGIALVLMKTAALSDLTLNRPLTLMAASGWGRWGQLVAILRYPYLKSQGKGAFHKAAIDCPWDLMLGLGSLLLLASVQTVVIKWEVGLVGVIAGGAIAYGTGAWFNHQLGGHTGDTYGAVVEWTEALVLLVFTLMGRKLG